MPKIAIVRGKYLNKYEMQTYELLIKKYQIRGFGSLYPIHNQFSFPLTKLLSPMDLLKITDKIRIPNRYTLGTLNRLMVDAHYLLGLEEKLNGFDIAHTAETYFHFTKQCLNAKKKGYVKKVVATIYENIPFNNEGIWGRREFKKEAIREIDHFLAVSIEAKNALIAEGCSKNKITIIPPGIDTDRFRPFPKKKISKNLTILFCGRIEKSKGIYDFINAANIIINTKEAKNYLLKFIIVGQGNELNSIVNLERWLNIENFISHINLPYYQMPQIYGEADIFVAPSQTTTYWREQFSMVLLEAQSCGLPIVTTDTGSIKGTVGDYALFVKERNPEELAKAIMKLIVDKNLRAKLGSFGRQRTVRQFDSHLIAKKIDKIYQQLL